MWPVEPWVLLAFVPAGLALNLTPGADMMFTLAQGLKGGPRAGMAANAGIAVGGMVHTVIAGLGLGALVAAHPLAFDVIRWAGVAYLLWLARRLWSSHRLTEAQSAKLAWAVQDLNPLGAAGNAAAATADKGRAVLQASAQVLARFDQALHLAVALLDRLGDRHQRLAAVDEFAGFAPHPVARQREELTRLLQVEATQRCVGAEAARLMQVFRGDMPCAELGDVAQHEALMPLQVLTGGAREAQTDRAVGRVLTIADDPAAGKLVQLQRGAAQLADRDERRPVRVRRRRQRVHTRLTFVEKASRLTANG